MSQNYTISLENPNDEVGGGGCLCNEERTEDCVGPFVIFPSAETSSNASPHVVLCAKCALGAARLVEDVADGYKEPDEVIELPESEVEEVAIDEESIPKV